MAFNFVHLHNHSEYSLLDGLSKIDEMVETSKGMGMESLAITDHGSLYGAIKFYKSCLEKGIKPIIGCEIYIAKRSRFDKDVNIDKDYNHLILLAKNKKGYKNLLKIVSISHLEGYYYKPRTDIDLLKKHSEGLICLSACVNGYISDPLLNNQEEEAENRLKILYEIYKDDFYLELQKHINVPPQEKLNPLLINLSKRHGVPLVATNDNHYIKKTDAEAQEILLCLQTQTTLSTTDRKLSMINSPDFYMKSPDEMKSLFKDLPNAIENTVEIAKKCDLEIPLGKWILPHFDVPREDSSSSYLRNLVEEGLKKRYKSVTNEIKTRMDHELSVILNKGYETYFLTVADFVNWAKDQGISVGPGRGSAPGSVVSYALGITDVDPFYFNLPFERFLNPERPSAPDIDLDFADNRRDEVINYVTKKYGEDKVAQIITFGTMEARGSVRDVGRVLGMPYAQPDRISKMIPPGWQGHAMTIDSALKQSTDLRRAYQSEPETKRLLDLAKKLEGVARHASVHAAGVVIADKDLTEYTPLQREPNGDKIVTQYDMYTVGEDGVGLLKMDFLGLRNLTIIQESLRFIKENKGKEVDLSTVSLDDPITYKLLSSGETTGIFQLESAGMRRYIKELKPTTIFDLMAMVALYRPGPMQNIPEFIARKHNSKLIKFPDPRLKDILSQSYGILAYQDDVLLTAIAIANYSWLDADKLRKAVGKKIPSEMKKQKEKFIKGAVTNGLTQKKAEELYDLIEPFAGYGFNKAHAACYATIAFRTAYLKAHYPVEFMTALLTAESRGTSGPVKSEKVAQAVAECRRLNVEILPPSVNYSDAEFTIENKTRIRFGLSAVKNVGIAAIGSILLARSNGKFKDFYDFARRVDLSKVNKKTLESLIKAGGMGEFGNIATLLAAVESTIAKINKEEKEKRKNQASLFNDDMLGGSYKKDDIIPRDKSEDFSDSEKLMFEKELLGFFLTNHPLNAQLKLLEEVVTHKITELSELSEGRKIKTGGIISQVKKIYTRKSNAEMAFIQVEDNLGYSIECVVFPKTYELNKNVLLRDTIVVIEGKLDFKDERPVVIVELIERLRN